MTLDLLLQYVQYVRMPWAVASRLCETTDVTVAISQRMVTVDGVPEFPLRSDLVQ